MVAAKSTQSMISPMSHPAAGLRSKIIREPYNNAHVGNSSGGAMVPAPKYQRLEKLSNGTSQLSIPLEQTVDSNVNRDELRFGKCKFSNKYQP